MNPSQYWQNFELGKEIDIACGFLYDGLRSFHELDSLDNEADIFPVLYNLSVGLERLLKVTIVLVEFNDTSDPEEFEKSLITHNHLDLINRLKKSKDINIGKSHNEILGILSKFYKSFRYDRYNLNTIYETAKEKSALQEYLRKYIKTEEREGIFGGNHFSNNTKTKKFLGKSVGKIVSGLYEIISDSSREKNIFTYEIRYHSKAYKLILGQEFDFFPEEILWKELLIFILNGDHDSSYIEFIKKITPLDFDPALLTDYLQAIQNDPKKIYVTEELECLYEEIDEKGKRLEMLEIIGNPKVQFD